MKKLFILLLSLCVFGASVAKPLTPRNTVISGRVINLDEKHHKVVAVNFCDPLNEENKRSSRLNPSGDFKTSYPMVFAQNITIAYDNKFINVFVEPGDSVNVVIDMNKFSKGDFSGLVFTGAKSKINNQLAAYVNYFYRLKMPELDSNLEPEAFLAQIKQSISQMEDSITVYAKKNKLDPFVVKWAKIDLKYLIANTILDYSSNDLAKRLKVFTDPVFDLYNDANFCTMLYQYHLSEIMNTILRNDTQFMSLGKADDPVGAFNRGVELLKKLPQGTSRDVMMYSFLERMARSDEKLYSQHPKDLFSEDIFYEKTAALFDKSTQREYPQVELDRFLYLNDQTPQIVQNEDVFSYLTSKYKGKVIYVDVWATWCGPCRAEFPAAKELHKLFHDKDVVFVNLCLASDQKNWIPTIKQLNVEGENYFLGTDATQLLMGGYGLKGYPSYILVGKDGKISTTTAPRPSNITGTSKAIDELLAK